mmetsp:Transcript_15010/g.19638  ORF Transcript_15010/g.19638 Transcript_15010/m.19638 type:complete len:360 (-) Transcript_15010:44-1123(-)
MESLYPGIAGFAAGTISTSLLLPLDVVKVRLQVHEGASSPNKIDSTKTKFSTNKRIGAMHVARGILKFEGIQGLYVGWTPAVIGSAVSWGGYFYVYESFKKSWLQMKRDRALSKQQSTPELLPKANVSLNSFDYFLLSCSAGGVMVCITNPIWLLKTRMQLQMKKASEQHNVRPYRNVRDAFMTIVRQEGPLALYKGTGAAFLLTSNGGIQFTVYEYLKEIFHIQRASFKRDNARSDETVSNTTSVRERFEKSFGYMVIGAVAKIIASTVTYPLQVAKSRIQQRAEALEFTPDGNVRVVNRHYGGLKETFQRIARSEGVSGLFKGCLPNAIRVAPSAAVTFVVYEITMDFLHSSDSVIL